MNGLLLAPTALPAAPPVADLLAAVPAGIPIGAKAPFENRVGLSLQAWVKLALAAGLEQLDLDAQRFGPGLQALVDARQRVTAMDLRLVRAQHVEIGAIQPEYLGHFFFNSSSTTIWRNSGVTSGITPNHNSNPRTAW